MKGVFRQDINALRAWAVVAVVAYHFKIAGFASGFVGVDIFFVISGYLIAGQALSRLEAGSFSFFAFWTARLRRIFPALLVLLASTAVAGWFLTMPEEFLKHVRQLLFAVTFISNIVFGDERGYFEVAAHSKPLLHTWSLAIEWQFYLLLPLFLVAIWRVLPAHKKPARVLAGLVVLMLASMIWCFWLSRLDAGAAFFSLSARAWELLMGGVIASLHRLPTSEKSAKGFAACGAPMRSALVILGWVMAGISPVAGLAAEHWPGVLTLLPVVGSALIIWGGPTDVLNWLADHWPVQRIGDWSYSIYLWHWPLWVFLQQWAGYRDLPVDLLQKTGVLVAAFGFGYLSYRYAEQPVRLQRSFWTPLRLWSSYLLALAGLTAFTVAAVWTHGFPQRVPEYQQRAELARRTNTPRDECFRNSRSEKREPHQFCAFGSPPGQHIPAAMLWGDSVANQYLEPLSSAASQLGISGLIATQSGCRSLLVEKTQGDGAFLGCERFNQEVLGFLRLNPEPRIVVLGRNWGNSAASATEALALVRQLLAAGKTVVLILPMLNLGFDVPERWMHDQFRAGMAIDELRLEATPELTYQALRDAILKQSREFANNPRFITVDLLPKICSAGYCYVVRDGRANFRDTLHISNLNAGQYEDIFVKALRDAINADALRQ